MRLATALIVAGAFLLSDPARSEPASPRPPDIDCSLGFEGLRSYAALLPGAQKDDEAQVIRVEDPDVWRAEFSFSSPGDVAHPVAALRTFIKQVTGVWTAQSKACGYGNQAQFAAVVAELKRIDTELTNTSRAEVERQKETASPIGH